MPVFNNVAQWYSKILFTRCNQNGCFKVGCKPHGVLLFKGFGLHPRRAAIHQFPLIKAITGAPPAFAICKPPHRLAVGDLPRFATPICSGYAEVTTLFLFIV